MAKITVTPPPETQQRTFTLILSEGEALAILAALGPSCHEEQRAYIRTRFDNHRSNTVVNIFQLYVDLEHALR